nr:MAG TPA: hypothetical protein [Microviridae sp.]
MEVKHGKYYHGSCVVRSHGRYSKNHKRNFFLKSGVSRQKRPTV